MSSWSHSAAATSSWVDSGLEAHTATSAPPAWRASSRLAVSVVTWRQAPTVIPASGRSFSNRSRISDRTLISPLAHSIRSRPFSARPRSLTSQSIELPSGQGEDALQPPRQPHGEPAGHFLPLVVVRPGTRRVRNTVQPEEPHPQGGDGAHLRHDGHPHHRGPRTFQVADLRGRLVGGAGFRRVHPSDRLETGLP